MITKIPNSILIAAWIGLLTTQAAGAHELPALAAVPAAKVVAAEVLAPLTGQLLAELDATRLANELTAAVAPPGVRLAVLPALTKGAAQKE